MRQLSQIMPFVRMSRYYFYNGGRGELERVGYIYSVHLFTGGRGYMIIDQEKYSVEKDTLIFIRPGQPHSFHIIDQPLQSYNIYCDLWTIKPPNPPMPHFAFYRDKFDAKRLTVQETCPELDSLPTCSSLQPFTQLVDLCEKIDKLFNQAKIYRQEIVDSLFRSWLLQWYNALHQTRTVDPRIIRLIEQMHAYPERRMNEEKWCRQSGLQRSRFYALFKKETGLSPGEYLIQLRMEKAATLLQESSRSVTSIAEELGYSSVHYFTRQFTLHYGVAPRYYRIHGGYNHPNPHRLNPLLSHQENKQQ